MDFSFFFAQTFTQALGITTIIYILAAIGLNLQFGYTGLLNFGVVAFVAVGAYAVAVMVVQWKNNLWLAIIAALAAAAVLALILGIPTLRLRADYLAIVTIGASEVIRLTLRSTPLADTFGGVQGVNGPMGEQFLQLNPLPAGFSLPFFTWTRQDIWLVFAGWTLIALVSIGVWLLVRSPWGRVVKGIREDEDAVRSLGKNTFTYKMQALVLGGMIGALGGVIWAVARQSVQADSYVPDFTFFVYTMLLLGGAARVLGPIVGGLAFWIIWVAVGEFFSTAISAGWIDFLTANQIGPIRFMLVGFGLMALMIFRPQGILGDRREIALDAR
jgi:neutral amino acid transport system permease protein